MIKKLQQRFIRIAVISLTVAMVLVVGIVNIANWISVRNELSDTLNLLAENATEAEEIEAKLQEAEQAETGQAEAGRAEENLTGRRRPDGENTPFRGPSRHFRIFA